MAMFEKLTEFGYARSKKQALGFYLAWFLMLFLVVMALGFVFIIASPQDLTEAQANDLGARVGNLVAVIVCTGLSYAICKAKGFAATFGGVVAVVGTVILSALGGGLIGMIVPAVLSAKSKAGTKRAKKTPPEAPAPQGPVA